MREPFKVLHSVRYIKPNLCLFFITTFIFFLKHVTVASPTTATWALNLLTWQTYKHNMVYIRFFRKKGTKICWNQSIDQSVNNYNMNQSCSIIRYTKHSIYQLLNWRVNDVQNQFIKNNICEQYKCQVTNGEFYC